MGSMREFSFRGNLSRVEQATGLFFRATSPKARGARFEPVNRIESPSIAKTRRKILSPRRGAFLLRLLVIAKAGLAVLKCAFPFRVSSVFRPWLKTRRALPLMR
jgi:hypothetical protein